MKKDEKMPLGDGIRRNLATVSQAERDRLRDAIVALNSRYYPGGRLDVPAGGVSHWFKQDEIHAHTHVHGCPAFLPWHREIVNRFEALIREVDPQLSLHYWDWTTDPSPLFTSSFMGSATGLAGDPWLAAGFYVPGASPFRSDNEFDVNNNPFDPPRDINRSVGTGAPVTAAQDTAIVNAPDFQQLNSLLTASHNAAHGFIGGTIGNPHTSFRDPFVFLLHCNIDRLFAMWQCQPSHPERLNPNLVYGSDSSSQGSGDVASGDPFWGILSPLEPWAGPDAQTPATGIIANVRATRPWFAPESEQYFKDSRHITVVTPHLYDTTEVLLPAVGARVLAVGRNGDGRLEAFARGSDQALYHIWQDASSSSGWSNWASLGGWIDMLCVGQNGDGRLEVFARGADQALYHIWQDSSSATGWSNWASLGGWIDLLAVGQNGDGRLEAFARGSDQALYHIWQDASSSTGWSNWASLGGWIDVLAVGRNGDGRLEAFARGSDQALYHIWQDASSSTGWSNWASLGGWIDLLAVGQNGDGRLEAFARGSDQALYHIWQDSNSSSGTGWSNWASLGGWIDVLAVGQNGDGRLEAFARGSDQALYHIWQSASSSTGWSDWASLGGWIDRIGVGKNNDGRLEVFARGLDQSLYHIWQSGSSTGWSDWASLGGWIDT